MTNLPLVQPGLELFVVDANVFMAAWRDNYRRDQFPGVWQFIEARCHEGRLRSIDRVFDEILNPQGLVDWAESMRSSLFASTDDAAVIATYRQTQTWAQGEEQYTIAAKEEFGRVADPWLAAYAKVHGGIVITNEERNDEAKRRIPLPNVCRMLDVSYIKTPDAIEALGGKFDWQQHP